MKITEEKFRCDLCGRFQDVGVTESYNLPATPDLHAETEVCLDCIEKAAALLWFRSAKLRALAEDPPF
jgi:hypothetical protein